MLVELSVMEQRYHAVMEVISGAPVTEVARRYGVPSQPCTAGWAAMSAWRRSL
jgi:transposase-like protein